MPKSARDWDRLADVYRLTAETRLARYEGRRTLADRIDGKLRALRFQFLPHYWGRPPKWRLRLRALGGPRTLPDFACVGPAKSGTTDLATYLFQHPSILAPLTKEIPTSSPDEWPPYYPTVREKARVEREHGKALSGFFNVWLHNLPLIDAFHAALPNARVILLLRNPVDRAVSQYKWDLFLGGQRQTRIAYYKTFADYVNMALDLFPATPLPARCTFPFLQTGIYVKSVELWMDRFGRENVHVVRSEDFFRKTEAVVCGVHEFLGIPPIKPETHEVVNRNPLKEPPIDDDARRRLAEFYRPWNEKLYALLGRDMGWD